MEKSKEAINLMNILGNVKEMKPGSQIESKLNYKHATGL